MIAIIASIAITAVIVNEYCSLAKVKSRNLSEDRLDMVVEVRTKDEADLVAALVKMEGVSSASLIAHDGEVTF